MLVLALVLTLLLVVDISSMIELIKCYLVLRLTHKVLGSNPVCTAGFRRKVHRWALWATDDAAWVAYATATYLAEWIKTNEKIVVVVLVAWVAVVIVVVIVVVMDRRSRSRRRTGCINCAR